MTVRNPTSIPPRSLTKEIWQQLIIAHTDETRMIQSIHAMHARPVQIEILNQRKWCTYGWVHLCL